METESKEPKHWVVKRWVAGVVVLFLFSLTALNTSVVLEMRKLQAHDQQQTLQSRINGRASLYAGCQSINEVRQSLDLTYMMLFAEAFKDPSPNFDPERASRALDIFRSQLGLSDCGKVLTDLPPVQQELARQVGEQMRNSARLPLPPVTIPGYVPATPPSTVP